MIDFLIKLFLTAVAVALSAFLLPGVTVEGFWASILVAGILALLNATLRPLLVLLTIPVTVFTLGLFLLVINALIILLVDNIVDGFFVDGFWWALLFSIILSVLNALLDGLATRR